MTPVTQRSLEGIHRRIRLTDVRVDQEGDEYVARVELAWSPAETFVGTGRGEARPHGRLRAAAEATAAALVAASGGRVQLDVLAVKSVEGFDTVIVVVSLASRVDDLTERLVGSCLIKGDAARGAVLATLTATNRLFGKLVYGGV